MSIAAPDEIRLRFATDDDMLSYEGFLDDGKGNGFWPRTDKFGNAIRSWAKYHASAMKTLDRKMRTKWSTAEPFELGRLDPRAQGRLRDAAAYYALHFLFVDINRDGNEFYVSKANLYWSLANEVVDAESVKLDYDLNRDGSTDENEKNQPFVSRVIRG